MSILLAPGPLPRQPRAGENLLLGDSSSMSSTIGAWATYGSHVTATWENVTNGCYPAQNGGNLKIVMSQGDGFDGFGMPSSGAVLRIAPRGGFKGAPGGLLHVVEFQIAYETSPIQSGPHYLPITLFLQPQTGGIVHGPNINDQAVGSAPYVWSRVALPILIYDDIPYIDFKVGRTDAYTDALTVHISGGPYGPKVYYTPIPPLGYYDALSSAGAIIVGALRLQHNAIDGTGGYRSPFLSLDPSGVNLQSRSNPTYYSSAMNVGEGYIYMNATGLAAPADLSGEGVQIEAGVDYVGLFIGEKDASTLQMYADYSSGFMMQLRHRGSGKGWSVSDDGTVNARIEAYFQFALTIAGALNTGTNLGAQVLHLPFKARIDEVRAHVGTAPTGAAILVDVNAAGTTIFTTQANRPSVAAAGTDANSGAPDGGTSVAKDTAITVDVDQVGSGTHGSDLTVFVRGRYIW